MKFIGYIATSLDGFIAREDGGLDWLEKEEFADPEGSDYGWEKHIENLDAMIMGKNTFLKVLQIGQWVYGNLEVFVASRSLSEKDIPEHLRQKVKLISGTAQELSEHMRTLGKKRIYIDGGKLLQSFIRKNLLDELTITRMPVLIGSGIPLFGSLDSDIPMIHIKTDSFKSSVTQSLYHSQEKK